MILPNLYKEHPNPHVIELLDTLSIQRVLQSEEYLYILDHIDMQGYTHLCELSRKVTNESYGKDVFMRGLIEFSNYCKQDCYYCGIRKSNNHAQRYRLTIDQILDCCSEGYRLGYRTFVLQGGEDAYFTTGRIEMLIRNIKTAYPDVAVTLSLGERKEEEYVRFFQAGADRYLLRHETASPTLYANLHPASMKQKERVAALHQLKQIGYQVGAGCMVHSPGQENTDLLEDLLFLQQFKPHMCGIGPYLSHQNTPLAGEESGTVEETITMVALVRLMLPNCLLPATTALGTLNPTGREQALLAGANVVMPNLSPTSVRELYEIYEGKICTGDEAAHCRGCIQRKIEHVGLSVNMGRGDSLMERDQCL